MPEQVRAPHLFDLLPLTSASPSETRDVGARLSNHFRPGAIVALYGELGAGKTELVKGVCRGLGIEEDSVHSPTFTIVNEYVGPVTVYHFDAYRLNDVEEFFDVGYEDYFFSDAISLVEWADRVEALLPPGTIRIRLSHSGEGQRRIEAEADR